MDIFERLSDVLGQAQCLQDLAQLFQGDNQLDAAVEAVSRSIDLLPDSQRFMLSKGHHILGDIYRFKGEAERAVNHYEAALVVPYDLQFQAHYSLAGLFCEQGKFDEAHTHIESAKWYADDAYNLGCAMGLQAGFLYQQGRLEAAKSEALNAVGVLEELAVKRVGAMEQLEKCRELLQGIERKTEMLAAPRDLDSELHKTVLLPTPVNLSSSARGSK